jgi:hypothetical protein
MNYIKHYCNLIRKAENRVPPEEYTEKHHTFPKSIFGNNNRIVILTGREHYIAHALLEKIYIKRYGLNDKKTIKMIHAHTLMKSKGKYYNSYLYNSAVIRKSEVLKGKPPYVMTEKTRMKMAESQRGKPRSEEFKRKQSERMKGKNNPNYGKPRSEEFKRKQSERMKGKKHTKETRQKWSEQRKGEKHPNYGKKRDVEIVNKVAEKNSKEFSIINPEGEIIRGKNIAKFCRENNLDKSTVCNMINYKRGIKSHKGYRALPERD